MQKFVQNTSFLMDWTSPPIEPLLEIIRNPECTIVDLLSDVSVFKFIKDRNPEITH